MIEERMNKEYTHKDYRKAKVIHLIDRTKEAHYLYKGKEITKEEADKIVEAYMLLNERRTK